MLRPLETHLLMDSLTDSQLVVRLNHGDEEAFAVLYARHAPWTARIARRFVDTDSEAAEVTQEVFLRWLRQFPGFQPRAKLSTYFYAAARNVALDRRRKDRRLHFSDAIEATLPPEAVPDPVVAAEHSGSLRIALSRLPDGFREVLLMRVVDGMSVEDVAVALGVAEGTVKSRLARAIELLRQQMGADESP